MGWDVRRRCTAQARRRGTNVGRGTKPKLRFRAKHLRNDVMREREMRERAERFFQRRLRMFVLPAALGAGMTLPACRSQVPPAAGPPAAAAPDAADPVELPDEPGPPRAMYAVIHPR